MPESLKQLLNRFVEQINADQKKAAILGGLFLVLIGVVLRPMMFTSSAPETALAATPPAAAPPPPTGPLLRPVAQAAITMPQPAGQPRIVGAAASATKHDAPQRGPKVAVAGMPRRLFRDPFDTNAWNRFPPAITVTADGEKKTVGRQSFWDRISASFAEQRKARRKQMEALRRDLAEMQLQSTMTGPAPLAYISGRLVREGEMLRGFFVVRIDDRRVWLRKDGSEHELAMP